MFSVKAFLLFLALGSSKAFLAIVVWNLWVPIRIGFFAWEASWERILTLGPLKRWVSWSLKFLFLKTVP